MKNTVPFEEAKRPRCGCGGDIVESREGFGHCYSCNKDYVFKDGIPFHILVHALTPDKVFYDLLEQVDDFTV